jgi:hypothetical protein
MTGMKRALLIGLIAAALLALAAIGLVARAVQRPAREALA